MKIIQRALAMLLSAAIVFSLMAGVSLVKPHAAVSEDEVRLYSSTLGVLSAKYESNGNPGLIATVAGDLGGKSYGTYMFASKADTPRLFFEWCLSNDSSTVFYQIGVNLYNNYYKGGAGYGSNFDAAWYACYDEYGETFALAQWAFVYEYFYKNLVDKIQQSVSGFNMENYSIALKNVFWSRAIQHGVSGATNVIVRAFANIGGFANQPESDLIDAIYAESGALTDSGTNIIYGSYADILGISNKYMKYYSGNSSDIQMGVYTRLRINEPPAAQSMLLNNGYVNAPHEEGLYQLSISNDNAAAVNDSGALILAKAGSGSSFQLTYYASGYYTITERQSGKRVAGSSDGKITLETPSCSDAQMWKMNTENGYTLRNKATGKYLNTSGAIDDPLNSIDYDPSAEGATAPTFWQFNVAGNGWSASGMSYPSQNNNLSAGNSSYPIRGILRSSSNIVSVQVAVENSNINITRKVGSGIAEGARTFDLSSLDNSITISRLNAGNYTFTVKATNAAGGVYELSSPFTIYTRQSYTFTFDPSGGTLVGEATKDVPIGELLGALPTATKEGKSFAGWFTSDGVQITEATMSTRSMTVYAQYGDLHTYTFLNEDGSAFASGSLATGALIPYPGSAISSDPSKSFSSWEGYTSGVTSMGTSDMTFKPVFVTSPTSGGESSEGTEGGPTLTTPVSAGFMTGITPGSSVAQLTARGYTVYSGDTQITDGKIGTGMKATSGDSTVTLVVTGDINGDGNLTITDVVKIQSYVVGKTTLSESSVKASDINGDGKTTITDVVQAAQVAIGKRTLG